MPEQFINFYKVSVGVTAAIIGLLSLALIISADFYKQIKKSRYLFSKNAFVGLAGVFLISLLVWLGANLFIFTGVSIILSIIGVKYLIDIINTESRWYVIPSIAVYIALGACSFWIIADKGSNLPWTFFGLCIIILCGMSIIHARRSYIIAEID